MDDTKTLRAKSMKTLEKELMDARIHLKELQFSLSSGQLSNVRDVLNTRKLIARIQTIIHEQNATQA